MWAEILRFRWMWLVMTVVTAAFFLIQLPQLQFSVDERAFFDKDDPFRVSLEELEARFSKRNTLMIALAPREGDIYNPDFLAVIYDLTEKMWQLPYVTRVNSLSNYQHIRAEDDDIIIESLVTTVPITQRQAETVRQIAENENDLAGQLVSEMGHVTALQITFVLPPENPNAAFEVMEEARNTIALVQQSFAAFDAYYVGDIALSATFGTASQDDIMTLFPIVLVIMAFFSFLFLRNLVAAVGVILVIMLSGLMTLGFGSVAGIVLTSGSAAAPTIVLTLAVADSMHLLMSFLGYRQDGLEKRPAMQMALRENVLPITLTTITTIIGFLSMNASEAPPFRDLGNLVAFGIFSSYWLSLLFLPAFILALPVGTPRELPSGRMLSVVGPWLFRRMKLMGGDVL